jgi:hypothetical protein
VFNGHKLNNYALQTLVAIVNKLNPNYNSILKNILGALQAVGLIFFSCLKKGCRLHPGRGVGE